MEGLLHNYGIFATEVVAVIRHISETSWRVCGIDWRVKQRESTARWLSVGSAHFHSVFRALQNHVSTTATKSRRNSRISLPGHIASLS